MTVREACALLACSLRSLHYILQAAGIPGGQRTSGGILSVRAADAVRRILADRRQVHPAVQAFASEPAAETGETARLWTAYETLYAETVWLRAEAARLQAVALDAYRALEEHEARLAAVERSAARDRPQHAVRALWQWLWRPAPRLQSAAVPTRQEFAPTEIWQADCGGGRRVG